MTFYPPLSRNNACKLAIESLERCEAIPLADVLAPYLEDGESDHLGRVLADLDEYVDGHENVVLE